MAEQLMERPVELNPEAGSVSAQEVATKAPSEALQQAKQCLDTAGRRLRRQSVEHADEVLGLLREATTHLHLACSLETEA